MGVTQTTDRADTLPDGLNRFDLEHRWSVVQHLIGAAEAILNDMNYALPSGRRNEDLDHVWAIVAALKQLSAELADMCREIAPATSNAKSHA